MTAMEAYNECFGEHTEDYIRQIDETGDLVTTINAILEKKLEPYRLLAIQMVKDLDEINKALDQSYAWGSDIQNQVEAIKRMIANTQRARMLFQHHRFQAERQLL